jgi:Tfp pilus assembly protein PilX
MRVSTNALQEVEAALREYEREVQASNMTPSTKYIYLLHSENFVKWLKVDFVPRGRKQ